MRARAPLGLLWPLLCTAGCTWFAGEDRLLVTSDPPGASVFVDGQDTGRTTPVRLLIGGNFGGDHVVELRKPGYRPAVRTVYQHTEGYTSKWIDGAYDIAMPPLPLFWTAGDFVFPFGVRGALVPQELHCKLYPVDAPKLGFEVLAERAAAARATTPP